MKINRNNQDLKIISRNYGYRCFSCELHSNSNLFWCALFCHPSKIWIKDICNSDIFRL